MICREIDGTITLKKNTAFTSIDFIGNKKLMCKSLTQGLATKLAQISILVIYECRHIENSIKQSAHIYLSNQTSHGWHSVITALKHYYQRTEQNMNRNAITLKSNIIFR